MRFYIFIGPNFMHHPKHQKNLVEIMKWNDRFKMQLGRFFTFSIPEADMV